MTSRPASMRRFTDPLQIHHGRCIKEKAAHQPARALAPRACSRRAAHMPRTRTRTACLARSGPRVLAHSARTTDFLPAAVIWSFSLFYLFNRLQVPRSKSQLCTAHPTFQPRSPKKPFAQGGAASFWQFASQMNGFVHSDPSERAICGPNARFCARFLRLTVPKACIWDANCRLEGCGGTKSVHLGRELPVGVGRGCQKRAFGTRTAEAPFGRWHFPR